eukprot:TRINITY_DN238_c0_g1_i1.p1 TRINITY_DN238_c0_g1~~TRINITY_DN238_c0_g1_i1.p1  ORF type:complete len:310 (+),score=59.40 TRINITY_DN238_c0_g1_i1:65-994(+)
MTASPEHIAEELFLAMKGIGTDEKRIVRAISGLDYETIAKVKHAFQAKHGKDLIKELKSETSSNFRKLIKGVMTDPVRLDAKLLHNAMKGLGTKDAQLSEVLIARHPNHLRKVAAEFKALYEKSLEDWISKDTSGDYRKYLLALVAGNRADNSLPVDQAAVERDADALYKAGEGKIGTDENVFIDIFAHRSYKHMRTLGDVYANKYAHSLNTVIKKEFSGDLERVMQWSLEFFESRPAFFAKRLYQSMEGLGTKDDQLIRIICTRRELDLFEIAQEYKKIYGKSLKEAVHSETSGDYRALMESVIVKCE